MFDTTAYLERIADQGDRAPTAETLRRLHLAHLRAVPFENLDIHLGQPIVLDEDLLFDKIVRRQRGGFCYELNGLFAALLRELGFTVTLLAAQFPTEGRQLYPEMDHLTLLIEIPDEDHPYLVDVGAGRGGFAHPLLARTPEVQAQPIAGAGFRLLPEGLACRLWRQEPGGDWERQYAFTWQPRQLSDFTEGCLFHQTSPESHFTQKRVCTLMTATGRITFSEQRLISTSNGVRIEQEISSSDYDDVLHTHFGINLREGSRG